MGLGGMGFAKRALLRLGYRKDADDGDKYRSSIRSKSLCSLCCCANVALFLAIVYCFPIYVNYGIVL